MEQWLRKLAWLAAVGTPGAGVGAQELLWLRTFGTAADEHANAVAIDGGGGFFAIGDTCGDLAATNKGDFDAWIGRFDRSGNELWIRQFGTSGNDSASGVLADGAGGIFAVGFAAGDLGGPSAGSFDVWLARYDGDGNRLWIVQYGTAQADAGADLVADGTGGVFIVGTSAGGLGGGPVGQNRAFIARHDSGGEQLWVRQIDTESAVMFVAAATADPAGGLFVVGNRGAAAFTARCDAAGEVQWIQYHGVQGLIPNTWSAGVAPDGQGGVLVGGWFSQHIYSGGGWLVRYDSTGNQVWSSQELAFIYAMSPAHEGGAWLGGPTHLLRLDISGDPRWIAWLYPNSINGLASEAPGNLFFGGWRGESGARDVVIGRVGACYANCDESTEPPVLNIADFACFLQRFAAGAPYANCDQSTTPPVLNVADFACFLQRFSTGCL